MPPEAVDFESKQCGTGWDDGLQQSSHTGQGYMMIYVFLMIYDSAYHIIYHI